MTSKKMPLALLAILLIVLSSVALINYHPAIFQTASITMSESNTTINSTSYPTRSAGSNDCMQLESQPLRLVLKNSSTGQPIPSVPVQIKKVTPLGLLSQGAFDCSLNHTSTTIVNIASTNSN